MVSAPLANLALASLFQDDTEGAARLATESLELCRELGDNRTIIECLHVLAGVEGAEGRFLRAATLTGAAEALHEAIDARPSLTERIVGGRFLRAVSGQSPEPERDGARSRGRAMGLDEALQYARHGNGA